MISSMIFKDAFKATKDVGRPSFHEKSTESRAFMFDFQCLFGHNIDLCITAKASFSRKRRSGYLETLFKQIKTPENLRF